MHIHISNGISVSAMLSAGLLLPMNVAWYRCFQGAKSATLNTSWPQAAHVCGVADGYVQMYEDLYD